MLYRYPIEQKKNAQETTVGNRRFDTATGADLPPIPYIPLGGAAQRNTDTANTATGKKTAAATGGSLSAEAAQQLLAQKRTALEKQYQHNKNLMQQNYNAQKQTAGQANNEALRQLYIAYMQGIKNIPQYSAIQGAGGEIESLKSRHRTGYENNRVKQNMKYADILGEIQQKYNNDLITLEEKYLKQLMGL